MKNVKIFAAATILTSLLTLSSPGAVRAEADIHTSAPAVVFVQDPDNRMLVRHHFERDEGFWVPGKTDNDPGFYVTIPQ